MTTTANSPAVDLEVAKRLREHLEDRLDRRRAIYQENGGMVTEAREDLAVLDALIAQARALPRDGEWVLVPREPTEAMLDGKARDVLLNDRVGLTQDGSSGRDNKATVIANIYRAMISVSALPPAGEVGSVGSKDDPSRGLDQADREPAGRCKLGDDRCVCWSGETGCVNWESR